MFGNIPRNVRLRSPECLVTFPGMFGNIPRNVRLHSPECLATFPGMFDDIPRNAWRHCPECLTIFPGKLEDIPRNKTFPPFIPRVLRIPFPVPLFLVLYIALYRRSHPEVFLGKGVLKICSKFTGEHPCQSAISIKLLCSIFSEHLFLATLLGGCF